jgi:hypothetical protein
MSVPTLSVHLDLNDPSTSATWGADITSYVRNFSTTRGVSTELQRTQAGTGTIVLDNQDGRFTPMNSLSPYYPNILPMRRIRIRAVWNAVTYPVFQGYVEEWPLQFPVRKDQIVTLEIVDGFAILALAKLSGTFSSAVAGTYIGAILDEIGWPAGDRDLDVGQSTIPATTLENVPALEHLLKVERAEGGRIFIARDGKLTFIDRSAFAIPIADYTGRTWADDGIGMSYRDLTPRFGAASIVNEARLTRTGGTEQVAQNTASATKYGTAASNFRSQSEGDILLVNDNDVLDLATWTVNTYGEPALRIEALQDNAMSHGHWDRVLSRDLADAVLVEQQLGGSDPISQESFIEGIRHSAPQGGEWRTTVSVSPSTAQSVFIWDTSRWDIDTRWAR